jgi:hypothetical protein
MSCVHSAASLIINPRSRFCGLSRLACDKRYQFNVNLRPYAYQAHGRMLVRHFFSRLDRLLQHLDLGTTMPCQAGEIPHIPEPGIFGDCRLRSCPRIVLVPDKHTRQSFGHREFPGVSILAHHRT